MVKSPYHRLAAWRLPLHCSIGATIYLVDRDGYWTEGYPAGSIPERYLIILC